MLITRRDSLKAIGLIPFLPLPFPADILEQKLTTMYGRDDRDGRRMLRLCGEGKDEVRCELRTGDVSASVISELCRGMGTISVLDAMRVLQPHLTDVPMLWTCPENPRVSVDLLRPSFAFSVK